MQQFFLAQWVRTISKVSGPYSDIFNVFDDFGFLAILKYNSRNLT